MKFNQANPMMIRFIMVLILAGFSAPMVNAEDLKLSEGQTVYVPIYSHIYGGDQERPFFLTAICSIRNTDPDHSISIETVDYYDSEGKLLEKYLKAPMALKPLASTRFVVKESDKSGGSGANFIVRWKSEGRINPAIIEGIMIGTKMQQGISFVSRGQVIKERE